MVISLVGTFVVYLFSILFFKSILDVSFILKDLVWAQIIAITLISWFPFFLFKKVKSCCYPDQIEKLRNFNDTKFKSLHNNNQEKSNSNALLLN